MDTAGHVNPSPSCAATRWVPAGRAGLLLPLQLSTSWLLQTAETQGHCDTSLSGGDSQNPAGHQHCPGRPPPGPVLPSACPPELLTLKHLLSPAPASSADRAARGAGARAGTGRGQPPDAPRSGSWEGAAAQPGLVLPAAKLPPHPAGKHVLWAQFPHLQNGATTPAQGPLLAGPQANVLCCSGFLARWSPAPANPYPVLPHPQGCPAPGRAPPLRSPPPAWPDVLQLAPCPPAAPQASRGPEGLTLAAGRRKIQFAADTSSRHPGPGQPAATAAKLRKWPQPGVRPAPLAAAAAHTSVVSHFSGPGQESVEKLRASQNRGN